MRIFEFLKKYRNILFIGISIIFMPILVIHILFSMNTDCQWLIAKWSAGELLDYFGSITGAAATIIAVILTIKHTNRSQNEQNVLQVKPYLLTKYTSIFNYQELCNNNNRMYISISNDMTSSAYEETCILKSIRKNEIDNIVFFQNYHILQYSLRNIGANSATNIKWTLNDVQLIPEFALSKDETREFIITIDANILENNLKELNFKFVYDDVLSIATYCQNENITIVNLSSGLASSQTTEDFLSPPKRL